ncbi:MAG: CRISPR-associated endonuclease Cas1 [Chitinophagales bacterium]
MQLVLDTYGLFLKKSRGSFQVVSKDKKVRFSPHRVSSILITRPCSISSDALLLSAEFQIPVFIAGSDGKIMLRTQSRYFEQSARIRRQQVVMASETMGTQWIIELFGAKAKHQIANLKYLLDSTLLEADLLEEVIAYIEEKTDKLSEWNGHVLAECRFQLMGQEGAMAHQYWRIVSACLPEEYQFAKRSRRPALDYFNSVLNYLYGMLYTVVEGAIFAAGLDAHFGVLHADAIGKPTFVYDMIEPFRPWIDALLIEYCLKNPLMKTHFEEKDGGIFLAKAGKAVWIPLFNKAMKKNLKDFNGKELSIKNHIHRFAGEFAKRLLDKSQEGGENQVEEEDFFEDESI